MKVGNMQKTFFIIKPDAVKRHLMGHETEAGFAVGWFKADRSEKKI